MRFDLQTPTLLDKLAACEPKPLIPAIQALLTQAAMQPWASAVQAQMERGVLHLVPGPAWPAAHYLSGVQLREGSFELVELTLVSPLPWIADVVVLCPTGEALERLETLLQRVFGSTTRIPPPGLHDHTRPLPVFAIGASVESIQSERLPNACSGVIRMQVWHHKFGRWMYFLQVGETKVERRYWDTDLRHRRG